MQNAHLPNTTVLLIGFVIVTLGVTVARWAQQADPGDRVIRIPTGSRFDLNSTNADALCLLPGIGPRLARRIIQARDHHGGFSQVEQLHHIPGIGPQIVSRITPWIVCEPR